MSKVDAQRAMREARWAERQRSTTSPSGTRATAKSAAPPAPARARWAARTAPVVADEAPEAEPALCGHRNMGGKTCRRPAGHSEKNHRYS